MGKYENFSADAASDPSGIGAFYAEPRALTAAQRKKLKKKQQTRELLDKLEVERSSAVNPGKEEESELRRQLAAEGRTLISIPGDGNCMFRAVEHQLSESRKKGKPFPNYDYAQLRKLVVEHLKAKRKYFEAFVYNISDDLDGEKDLYEEYCKKIAKDGEWGGELELQALSEILSCRIVVYKQKTQPVVYVCFQRSSCLKLD